MYPKMIGQGGAFTYDMRDAVNALIAGLGIMTPGNVFYVKPRTGLGAGAGGDGSPDKAFKTVAEALAAATADQNDVVVLVAESNTASKTTDYQNATLDWNKDGVHLIGVNAGPAYSPRSRIAFTAAYATASNLFTLSANGCMIYGIELFEGVASAAPVGCMKVTGKRNHILKSHIAGIGNDANDIAGAYSLRLSGSEENLFEDCVIGLDTIGRGTAANSEILVDGGSTRDEFRNCKIVSLLDHASNHPQVKLAAATSIDKTLLFTNCQFINESVNYAIAQAGIFKLVALLTQGYIILTNCYGQPSDNSTVIKWDADDRNQIALFNAPTPAADTAGMARMV